MEFHEIVISHQSTATLISDMLDVTGNHELRAHLQGMKLYSAELQPLYHF
jgi:hypothetical protein